VSSNEGRDRCPDIFILLTFGLNGRTDRHSLAPFGTCNKLDQLSRHLRDNGYIIGRYTVASLLRTDLTHMYNVQVSIISQGAQIGAKERTHVTRERQYLYLYARVRVHVAPYFGTILIYRSNDSSKITPMFFICI